MKPELADQASKDAQQTGPSAKRSKLAGLATRKNIKHILIPMLLLIVVAGGLLWHSHNNETAITSLSNIKGTSACIGWVKKIEGSKTFSGIKNLECTLSPRKIANSNLKAERLDYSGSPADQSACGDNFGVAVPGGEYCVGWDGVVLSNGTKFEGIGDSAINEPADYDACYSSNYEETLRPIPTIHDLYFYNNILYDRDVYDAVNLKTPYGDCTLNGTSIYHPETNTDGTGTSYYPGFITNVKVTYQNAPSDCFSVTVGKPGNSEGDCIDFWTAANASLEECHSNLQPVLRNHVIDHYNTPSSVYSGQYTNSANCDGIYLERLAATNMCSELGDPSLLNKCQAEISTPDLAVKRITSQI